MSNIKLQVSEQVSNAVRGARQHLRNTNSLHERIAKALEAETAENFQAGGRPHWVPHSKAYIAQRRRKGHTVLAMLQQSGMLASSISSAYGPEFAVVGTNVKYAAIHQYGGMIDIPAHNREVWLREDAKGNLLRQGKSGRSRNLAVFARRQGADAHKRVRQHVAAVDAYQIKMPARPFLPFAGPLGNEVMQPEAERTVLATIEKWLAEAFD
jgi:phage virion morphogenesis protein